MARERHVAAKSAAEAQPSDRPELAEIRASADSAQNLDGGSTNFGSEKCTCSMRRRQGTLAKRAILRLSSELPGLFFDLPDPNPELSDFHGRNSTNRWRSVLGSETERRRRSGVSVQIRANFNQQRPNLRRWPSLGRPPNWRLELSQGTRFVGFSVLGQTSSRNIEPEAPK